MTSRHINSNTGNVGPYVTGDLRDAFAYAFVAAEETGHELELYHQPDNENSYVVADSRDEPYGRWVASVGPNDLLKSRRGYDVEADEAEAGIIPSEDNRRHDTRPPLR
jgi:hypothetical protein